MSITVVLWIHLPPPQPHPCQRNVEFPPLDKGQWTRVYGEMSRRLSQTHENSSRN